MLVLGVAYKQDIDDYRESPALRVIECLENRGANVIYYDPWVAEYRYKGAVKQSIPELTDDVIENADLVMVTCAHTNVDYAFRAEARPGHFRYEECHEGRRGSRQHRGAVARQMCLVWAKAGDCKMKCAIIGCGRIAVNHVKAVANNDLRSGCAVRY